MFTHSRAALWAAIVAGALLAQDAPLPTHDIDVSVTEGTAGMKASASPDHQWIAIDLLGSIWLVPLGGGEAKKLTPDSLEAYAPAWAPDSQTVAFEALGDDGAWHVESINIDGKGLKSITEGLFEDRQPAWSHDGTRILFTSDRGGDATSIWEVTLGSRALRRMTTRAAVNPAWAPHDEGLAFASPDGMGKWGIWTIDADGREQEVGTTQGLAPTLSWNPTTNKLSWIGGRERTPRFHATVKLKRADYSAARRVLEPSDPQPLRGIVSPAVSPDGTKVAFTALGDLWVLPIGEQPVKVTDDPSLELDPAWSPDGFKLAFASDRTGSMELWMHDFRAGVAVPLTREDESVSGAAWSPDGARIAFLRNHAIVASVPVPGTVSSCRALDSSIFAFLALGRLLVPDDLGRPTWAPDSCTVAVGSLFPYTPRLSDGLNQLLLYAFDRQLGQDLVHPSGSFTSDLLFPEHSVGNRRGSTPVWSPDGFKIAFVSDGKLWVVPVDSGGQPTGPPSPVADDLPDSPTWQRDSEHLVYVNPNGLRRTTGALSESINADLAWAPNPPPQRVIVHAGQMFDGVSDRVLGQTDFTIENGVITRIDPHSDQGHAGAVVDAGDEFVMPGFIDARVHLDPSYGESLGRIWLAYGVTSVRDVSLNPYAGVEQREAVGNGRRIGPRVFIAGDPFDGRRVREAGGVSIGSEQVLDTALQRATLLGVDGLVVRGRMAGPLEQRLVEYAHAHGLRATTGSLFAAMAFGYDELDFPVSQPVRSVVNIIGKSGMLWAPEFSASGGFAASYENDRSMLRDARLGLFPVRVAERYKRLGATAQTIDEKRLLASLEDSLKPRREALKAIVAAGGRVVAGTNAPGPDTAGSLLYGLSLHAEMEQLVLAGMTPFRALQAATMTAADALGAGDAIGTIEVGKLADLVFLGGDPLQDIRRTRDVRRVMRGGRLYDPGMLGVLQQPTR